MAAGPARSEDGGNGMSMMSVGLSGLIRLYLVDTWNVVGRC